MEAQCRFLSYATQPLSPSEKNTSICFGGRQISFFRKICLRQHFFFFFFTMRDYYCNLRIFCLNCYVALSILLVCVTKHVLFYGMFLCVQKVTLFLFQPFTHNEKCNIFEENKRKKRGGGGNAHVCFPKAYEKARCFLAGAKTVKTTECWCLCCYRGMIIPL